jgi:hypothetical protein
MAVIALVVKTTQCYIPEGIHFGETYLDTCLTGVIFVLGNMQFLKQDRGYLMISVLSQALVDYEGDSDEKKEEEGGDVLSPSLKRARLT